MNCPKCEFQNREGAKFCLKCGSKFEMKCPECGRSLPPEAFFCDECGHDFKKSVDKAPIDYAKPQSYTPKHLAEKILTTRSSLEGERKVVTVLFADVANYTSMSEKLDPEEVLQIMDGAFKIMMDETHKYEGTINQFTGDGIMAIFGAPVAHENHAQRACYAALSIQSSMIDYTVQVEKKYGIDFKIRIGLNSGVVIVSAIGDDLRMDYTAVGDTTNLAARMENAARPGTICASGETHKIVERYFEFNHIGKTEIKGKEEPQDIYELLKAGEVITRIDESIAKGLTRFVGRKNSMDAMMEVYNHVKSGLGQVVGVVGEAGVGKSRLILEFRNQIIKDSHTFLEGQCLQYGGSILYKPILDILKSLFDIKEIDREHIIKKKIRDKLSSYKDLEPLLPSFQDLLSVQVDNEAFLKLEPKQKREKAFEAIRDLIISDNQEKPLVVVVEDLHWIDDSSEEFLNYLIEWIANTPIMLILLYRTEYQHKWGSKTYYYKIGLDHLDKESAVELVKAMLEDGDVAPELRDLILSRAAGNPLFMEEFTHTLMENGTIKKQDNQYILSRKITDINVPDTVQGIIAARMDRLEENLKRTMQVASVIGRDFAFRILQTITGMHGELKSYLLNLQGLEFIYEKRLFPELEYIFKHALTQEVAYNSLLLKRRKQIHENIGKAIEELYSERLEEFYEMLAYHYSRSDNQEKAYQYLILSGKKAFSSFANQEAYNFYQEGLKILRQMPNTEENKKIMTQIIKLMYHPMTVLSYPEGSLEILQNGVRLSKEICDKKSLATFYGLISECHTFRGNPLEGIKDAEPLFYEARRNQDIDLMAPLSYGLIISYGATGDWLKVRDIAPEVVALIDKTRKERDYFKLTHNFYSIACAHYGNSLVMTGNLEEGKNFIEKGLGSAIETNRILIIATCEYTYGNYCLIKGDGGNAIKHFQNAIIYSEKGNWPWHIAISTGGFGYGCYLLGDLDTARKQIEKGLNIHKNTQSAWMGALYSTFLSYVLHDSGDLAEAQDYAEEAIELSMKNNDRFLEGLSNSSMGRILVKRNSSRVDEAEKYVLKSIQILNELKACPYLAQAYFYLGELYANAGFKDKARENLRKALSMYREMDIKYWPDKIQEVLDRL
jgi:class 3 adenylate cyclase